MHQYIYPQLYSFANFVVVVYISALVSLEQNHNLYFRRNLI